MRLISTILETHPVNLWKKHFQVRDIKTSKPNTYDQGDQLPPTNFPPLEDCYIIQYLSRTGKRSYLFLTTTYWHLFQQFWKIWQGTKPDQSDQFPPTHFPPPEDCYISQYLSRPGKKSYLALTKTYWHLFPQFWKSWQGTKTEQ